MERRKLLQALTALPAMAIYEKGGEQIGVAYETKPKKNYVIFVNGHLVDVVEFCTAPVEPGAETFPIGTPVHAVFPNSDQSVDDVIRIYEVEKA